MKLKLALSSLFCCLAVSPLVFMMSACHLQNRTDTTIAAQTAMDRSNSGNHSVSAVYQTGQKRKVMAGDDGDLRIGKSWPAPRFTDNGDGTVTDRLTGLMWTQNADQAGGTLNWEEALARSAACSAGAYNDWRLPNRNELQSLIDLGKVNPALPEGHPFSGVHPSYYWTSTALADNEDNAWIIHFYIGLVVNDDIGGSHYVWYVRSHE
jgi:hypothetical protein